MSKERIETDNRARPGRSTGPVAAAPNRAVAIDVLKTCDLSRPAKQHNDFIGQARAREGSSQRRGLISAEGPASHLGMVWVELINDLKTHVCWQVGYHHRLC